MTHDELLAKLAPHQKTVKEWLSGFQALRAVVELHSQNQYIDWTTVHQDELTRAQIGVNVVSNYCKECKVHYPCPTIRAIQSALD